ncbi:hypothetical protein FOA43_001684 [Brettanomyces nanus]|uniref:Uncharacterized protein n=1 Tax=Eeniella nana TaxID=13502 RepID=A0A875RUA5_EENNA|nr:uncharacterized protein FOA43_001684 [Brettanomyces nanus]QPG74357.1 hypothetical protein FOA43_001684 [Brettanomyces nanus]
MTSSIIPGVYTPIVTFYKADGFTIDYETQIAHAKYLKKSGITGLVVLGSTGENALLSGYERHTIISRIRQALPDFPIIGGIAKNNLSEAIAEISAVKKAGANIAMVLPSNYYGNDTSQEGLYDWYTEVADNSALPLIIYVYPGVCNGLCIQPRIVRRLCSHKNIIGCKCSHGDVQQYTQISLSPEVAANNFSFFSGQGQLLVPLLAINGKGVVDALSGAFPKTFVAIYNALKAGDFETAKKYQYVAAEAEVLAVRAGFLGIKRAIRDNLGFGETIVGRKPMNHPQSEEVWASEFQSCFDIIKKLEDTL